VAVYIDGFNVFYSLKARFGKKYYWADYMSLAKSYLQHNEKLVDLYYFTAYFTQDMQGAKKHKQYVSALTTTGVKTIL
jgi:hypothetical protein